MILKITFWILISYIVTYIIGRILSYSAAILHNWCMLTIWDHQYWYNKGTTIKDIYNKISKGDHFQMCEETKFIPLANLLVSLLWLFCELLFLLFVILVLIIKLIIFIIVIFNKFIYKPFLSKIFKPVFKFCKLVYYKIKKIIQVFITIFNYIKEFILNLKIA